MKSTFKKFIPFAFILTLTFGTIYCVAQQIIRQTANNTPDEIATDIKAQLEEGYQPTLLVGDKKVDIEKSYSPFITIFGADNKIIASNAILRDKTPMPPTGILEFAKSHGINKITWQPKQTAREATVVKFVNSGNAAYVMAGHNLLPYENLINSINDLVLVLWLISMVVTFTVLHLTEKKFKW